MKQRHTHQFSNDSQPWNNRGISLIELMIATAIGLVITVLAINYLTSNLKTRNVNAAYATMKDNGALSLYFLARYTRGAGIETTPINGSTNISSGNCEPNQPWCTQDLSADADRLAIRKVFPDDMEACNGEISPKGDELVEIFSVLETNDYKALVCQSYSLSNNDWLGTDEKRVLQTGIDDFQVMYFETGQASPVSAANVTNWGNIHGIEVAFIANSEIPAHLEALNQNLSILNAGTRTFNDRLARHIFQTSIAFNNMLLTETTIE